MESGQEVAALRRRENVAAGRSANSVAAGERVGHVAARERAEHETHAKRLDFVWRLYPLALITIFPVALVSNFWLEVWRGVRSHATDGSGHWGVAQIYNAGIFPDTFGWTDAYFGGMPFPNFYPPLFHWLVGLLGATGLLSFGAAFKLVLFVPTLLMPAAVWLLARRLSGGSARVALASGCACVLLLVNMRFQTSTCGLDYASTFVAGFYTQPLGFVLLLAWFAVYVRARRSRLCAAASCILLALTVLGNFFNAFTAALLVAATLAFDLLSLRDAKDAAARAAARRTLVKHFVTPLVALALCLFWLVPMAATYQFFVTRPLVIPLGGLITPWLWAWYAVAAVGVALWWRRSGGSKGRSDEGSGPSCEREERRGAGESKGTAGAPASLSARGSLAAARAYVLTLLALAACVVFASTVAPPWFPLQAFRFLSTLNFMLAVPVGVAVAAALDFFKIEVRRPRGAWPLARHVAVVILAVVAFGLLQSARPTGGLAFYTPDENERLEAVLRFAREHRDGRYMVEVLNLVGNSLHADSPALNAYLGAQGNETLGVVYREASPNSVFFNALTNAVSTGKDSFGISSVLADDLDFAAQPLARHLARARWLGVRYVVAESDELKGKLAREPSVVARQDFDRWSVFEIGGGEAARARVLDYRPALVVSDFSVKGRRRNDFDFVRLAEEQFADGWFDVLLARSPETKIERLTDLENFGALVLERYDCDDQARAFALLRAFAQTRALVLLSSDAPLFRRIQSSLREFPHAHVVERTLDEPAGERVESFQPSFHYEGSSIRRLWRDVRAALESEKVAVAEDSQTVGGNSSVDPKASVKTQVGRNELSLTPEAPRATVDLPVLVATTYSPDWRAREGRQVYAATPFFMLTFARGPAHLVYSRSTLDRAGLWASALTLLALCCFAFIPRRESSRGAGRGKADALRRARRSGELADERIVS
ncbi:MAG: hypothetical protein M3348_07945 [Acidobacteriota bacterium]|nr:hypothetical protein [Acidobacteriota bacterium]